MRHVTIMRDVRTRNDWRLPQETDIEQLHEGAWPLKSVGVKFDKYQQ